MMQQSDAGELDNLKTAGGLSKDTSEMLLC